jgi:hypothetical protein
MTSTLDTYRFSDEDELVSGEIDPDLEYTEADVNNRLVVDERELSRVHEFMDQINQRHKTLVLCATPGHAARGRNFINQVKGVYDRVQADYRPGDAHVRRQLLFHDLRLRPRPRALPGPEGDEEPLPRPRSLPSCARPEAWVRNPSPENQA